MAQEMFKIGSPTRKTQDTAEDIAISEFMRKKIDVVKWISARRCGEPNAAVLDLNLNTDPDL